MGAKDIIQFGTEPTEAYTERHSAYVVLFDQEGRILVMNVNGTYHLPGGGIDEEEEPEAAVIRETKEESGYAISGVKFLLRANQYFSVSKTGPLNKIGIFYKAVVEDKDSENSGENDHHAQWVTPDEFISGPASEFQKWAVKNALL